MSNLVKGIATIDPKLSKRTTIFTKNDSRKKPTQSQDDSGILSKPSSPTTTSDLVNSLDLPNLPSPSQNIDSSNPLPPSPPTASTSEPINTTPITQIVQPIVHAIMDHKQSLQKSKEMIDKNIEELKAKGETEAADKLKKEQEVATQQVEKEKNTVYDIKAHITLYSDDVNNAVYYKNVTVELFSYDSDKKLGFLSNKPSPYTYDFNDASRFTKLTNVTINEYTNKFNLDSIITNLDQATKYDKFNKGWVNESGTIPPLTPGKTVPLIIDLQLFIKDVNIYAELPKVVFGQPTNLDAKTIGTLTKINKNTKPEDMNAKIVFGPVKDSLKDAVLKKLNAHYQHTEEATLEKGFNPLNALFGNQTGGKKSLSYLLKHKMMKKKTLKKLPKKFSKKIYKKVSKMSKKSKK